jgi:hypothetical protein
LRDLQLFLEVHAATGRLLAVAERGVKNDDVTGFFCCGHGRSAKFERRVITAMQRIAGRGNKKTLKPRRASGFYFIGLLSLYEP